MTSIYLHGELRNKFGSEFKFKVNSAKEALQAINANRRGFLNETKKLAVKGVHYRVIVDDYIIINPKEAEIKKIPKEIHIVPIVWGAGTGIETAIWYVLMDMGLEVATAELIMSTMYYVAVAAVTAGIMMMLYPQPKPDFNQEVMAGSKSYLFGNKPNNTAQGQAVPVGYGRLKIAGSQISAGISHHPLNLDVKQFMTPADKPINDYTLLEFENESPDSTDGLFQNSFSTDQAANIDESISFASATIVNSYIDITSKNAYKVTSAPVEVVVKRDGEIVSNVNLDSYDEDIEYEWSIVESEGPRILQPPAIKIEKPYAFENGLVFRTYHPKDYGLRTYYENVASTGAGYFVSYRSGELVKFGPSQFQQLRIGDWDFSERYYSGQVVKYTTGTQTDVYFQTFVTGTGGLFLGFDGLNEAVLTNPTGSNGAVREQFWKKITVPLEERIYKALQNNSGQLPSTGVNFSGNLPYWTGISSIDTKIQFDELLSGMPNYKKEGVYQGIIEAANEQRAIRSNTNVDNYAMEFMGYLYIPVVEGLKRQVPDASNGVMYEILKVGDTGQWSGIGLTGAGGIAIPPKRGVTFVKNSTQSTGDGVVYPVVKYNFKIDSDDAADLYIDGQSASTWYGNHGFVNPTTNAQITGMPSTSGEILLTAGYHHIYGRFQDVIGGDGISFYYQYDTNWDGSYSDFVTIPSESLKYRPISDMNYAESKFMPRSWQIPVANMKSGQQYKIVNIGTTTNWGSFGASSPRIGTVFTKTNNTPANGNGFVFEDLYNYAESKSSEANRVVQFSAERPKINGIYSNGYSSFSANYNCKVTLDGITLTTSPVRIKIKMLETDMSFANLTTATLPIENYKT